MPDWAIVLVAAFGGGLAGAVLQPVVACVFRLANSAVRRCKPRTRRLRRMIAGRMEWGRVLGATLVATSWSRRRGLDVPLSDEVLKHVHPRPTFLFPENWIEPEMRERASAFFAELEKELLPPEVGDDDETRAERLERLNLLGKEILARMDELNWPEVDE